MCRPPHGSSKAHSHALRRRQPQPDSVHLQPLPSPAHNDGFPCRTKPRARLAHPRCVQIPLSTPRQLLVHHERLANRPIVLELVIVQLFASGAGIKSLPSDHSLVLSVRVLFMRFQDLFKLFDIPIDNVEQDLPALGPILECRQFGTPQGDLLAQLRKLVRIKIAAQFTERLGLPPLELGAGIEDGGAGIIEPRVDRLMSEQADGLEPIGCLPEFPRLKPCAARPRYPAETSSPAPLKSVSRQSRTAPRARVVAR